MDTKLVVADFEDWREAVAEAVALLEDGQLVALPTETVYGLAADAFDAEAVAKVFEVKERPSFDPLIVHIGHKRDLDMVADVPEELQGQVAVMSMCEAGQFVEGVGYKVDDTTFYFYEEDVTT